MTGSAGAELTLAAQPDVSLALPPRLDSVAMARGAAAIIGRRMGFSPSRLEDLRVVVSEAFTNAVEAQVRVGAPDALAVRIWVAGSTIAVEIEDRGPGFELAPEWAERDETAPVRGLGISLIRRLADEFRVTERPGGGALAMILMEEDLSLPLDAALTRAAAPGAPDAGSDLY